MDIDGYPTDEELDKIKTWDYKDYCGLMAYVHARWKYADCGYWEQKDKTYKLHTAGWSGNESIVNAMQENIMFWLLYWFSTTRGGHYIFRPSSGSLLETATE
jgi:hypothetical protein